MRILAFSDSHGRLPKIDPGVLSLLDCIMVAGDVCPTSNQDRLFQKVWLEDYFGTWAKNLKKPVYLTLGNHDLVDDFQAPSNLRYGTCEIVDDVLLFSWTPKFGGWAWEEDDCFLALLLESLFKDKTPPSIWLTHGPPLGVCDGDGENQAGSYALRKAIELYQPRLVICGHIHFAAGFGTLGRTKIYNVSILDAEMIWNGNPVIIDI